MFKLVKTLYIPLRLEVSLLQVSNLWGPLHRLGPEALSNGTVRGAFLQVSVPFSFQSYSFSFFHHVLGLTDLKSNETHRNAKEIFYAFHCA